MNLYDLVKISGTTSLSLVTLTFVFGFFNINIRNRIKIHRWFAILTLVFVLVHMFLVLYMNLK